MSEQLPVALTSGEHRLMEDEMTATQTTVNYTPCVNWGEVLGALTIKSHHVRDFATAKARLDELHDQLQITITNLVGMAERAMERFDSTGDVAELTVARDAMDEAAPYIKERAELEALWVKA